MSHKRRTEDLSVKFVNREAEGWAFGVGDWFRMQLDIRLDSRMDTEANAAKKLKFNRALEASEKIKRLVWTQGSPPAYSFDRGHLFHELLESQDGLRRSIIVVLARPDAGSLREALVVDESGVETTVAEERDEDGEAASFVDYEVITYKFGAMVTDEAGLAVKQQSSRSQAGFVELLHTGR